MNPILVSQKAPLDGNQIPAGFDLNGELYFIPFGSPIPYQLWKSDGTDTGTTLATTLPSPNFGYQFTVVDGNVFFRASNNDSGTELWKTDGTAAGTQLVKDISPVGSSNPGYLTSVNGTLFFTADENGFDDGGIGLWKSDGTSAGTQLLKSFNFQPSELTDVNGTLFFIADDAIFGKALWKSDGTVSGTQVVNAFIGARQLTDVNGTLFFTISGDQIWTSDGTEQGTKLVKDIDVNDSRDIEYMTDANGVLFFTVDDGIHGKELWKSDGTEQGTQLVKDVTPPSVIDGTPINDGTHFKELINVDGTVFFLTIPPTNPNTVQLWKSDGTEQGTQLLKEGFSLHQTGELTNVNGTLFFRGNDSTHGTELWQSDGTVAGTVLVQDLNPGSSSSTPYGLTVVNKDLFFGTVSFFSAELYKLEGDDSDSLIVGDAGNNNLVGGAGNDTLQGLDGKDTLNGGKGVDSLVGGLGNDTYTVDNAGDVIIENPNEGTDTVKASISYTLANHIEKLTLTGTKNIKGTGNSLNNTLMGNSGNNRLSGNGGNDQLLGGKGNDILIGGAGKDILNGGNGQDTMQGGLGNDTYLVNQSNDLITESLNQGTDTVKAAASYTLSANVENLILAGEGKINGTGNSLNNTLTGNGANNRLIGNGGNDQLLGEKGNDILIGGAGNDSLNGGAGDDLLTGGKGADQFFFGSGKAFTSKSFGVDTLNDFIKGSDKIVLSKVSFTKLTSAVGSNLKPREFTTINDATNELSLAGSSTAKIVYNLATGSLFYNPDGATIGLGNGGLFTTLDGNQNLGAGDFLIQT